MTAEASCRGQQRPRMGNDLYGAFGRDFATRDGQRLMLVAITPRQWSKALEVLGLAGQVAALEAELGVSFAADEGLRFTHRDRLYPLFEAAFARRTLSELAPLLDGAGVTHGGYQSLRQAVDGDARLASNLTEIDHPSGHRYPTPDIVAGISSETRTPPVAAPRLGQHTDEVLAERLGLSSAEIGRLHDQGLVAGPTPG